MSDDENPLLPADFDHAELEYVHINNLPGIPRAERRRARAVIRDAQHATEAEEKQRNAALAEALNRVNHDRIHRFVEAAEASDINALFNIIRNGLFIMDILCRNDGPNRLSVPRLNVMYYFGRGRISHQSMVILVRHNVLNVHHLSEILYSMIVYHRLAENNDRKQNILLIIRNIMGIFEEGEEITAEKATLVVQDDVLRAYRNVENNNLCGALITGNFQLLDENHVNCDDIIRRVFQVCDLNHFYRLPGAPQAEAESLIFLMIECNAIPMYCNIEDFNLNVRNNKMNQVTVLQFVMRRLATRKLDNGHDWRIVELSRMIERIIALAPDQVDVVDGLGNNCHTMINYYRLMDINHCAAIYNAERDTHNIIRSPRGEQLHQMMRVNRHPIAQILFRERFNRNPAAVVQLLNALHVNHQAANIGLGVPGISMSISEIVYGCGWGGTVVDEWVDAQHRDDANYIFDDANFPNIV